MILVADDIRITRKTIQIALDVKDPAPIQAMATAAIARGAKALDINAGPLTRNPEAQMAFLVEAVSSVTDLPLFIDTTNPAAMAAGLAQGPNPKVINGISLEPVKLKQILPLALEYGVPVVGFLLDEKSRVGRDSADRLEMAAALGALCAEAGIPLGQILFDPVVPPLAWEEGLYRAREVVKTLGLLPQLFGEPVKSLLGLSNLTTGGPDLYRREVMESAYVSMLAGAGLSHVLMDTGHGRSVEAVRAAALLSGGDIFSWASVGENRGKTLMDKRSG